MLKMPCSEQRRMGLMMWQEKLRLVIQADQKRKFSGSVEFESREPIDVEQVDLTLSEIAVRFDLDPQALESLRDLYTITDGLRIIGLRFLGLADGRFAFGPRYADEGTILRFNELYLRTLQENAHLGSPSDKSVRLIIGMDDVSDSLCLSVSGSLLLAGRNTPEP